MAVYTEVTDAALAEFLADYDLGAVLALKGIAEGVENSNYLLHVETGHFILTLYEKRVEEAALPFFLSLMEHLAARGLRCPRPVRNKKGSALGRVNARPAAIVTFLEGLSRSRPDAEHCAIVGDALGKLHLAGADFPDRRENTLALPAWPRLFEQAHLPADAIAPGTAAMLEKEIDFLERNWPRDLPRGIIHADLFPDNVLFMPDAPPGLIDFYFACSDDFAFDLAVCLNAWCFEPDVEFNHTKAVAMCDAYRRIRALAADEIEAVPILARGAALRFALTRLVDGANIPKGALVHPKDPREYLKKLRFHQMLTSPWELGLIG